MNLYLTADVVGTATGGGLVTYHEREALRELGELRELSGFALVSSDPFQQDQYALDKVRRLDRCPDIVHCYSGCLSETVKHLRSIGAKVTYTVAAHSIEESRKEHEFIGIPYEYTHLTDLALFAKYTEGYRCATRIICPSTVSSKVLSGYGMSESEVIPHGVNIPTSTPVKAPKNFTVGYLGAVGPDKGLPYLFSAWKRLAYRDAVLKIAGKQSTSDYCKDLLGFFGGGNVLLQGWVDNAADFYNGISCYVQPSASEGFGLEVLEALAHGRPVIVSDGAGAADVLRRADPPGNVFVARNVPELVEYIDRARKHVIEPARCVEVAKEYSWEKIRARYQALWRAL